MSTEKDRKQILDDLTANDDTIHHKQSIADLSESLEKEKEERLEERFIWCLFLVLIFGALVAERSGVFNLLYCFLSVTALLILAKRWGIDEIVWLINKVEKCIVAYCNKNKPN